MSIVIVNSNDVLAYDRNFCVRAHIIVNSTPASSAAEKRALIETLINSIK